MMICRLWIMMIIEEVYQPTTKVWRGIAILSGDALLNLAYETMLENALLYQE